MANRRTDDSDDAERGTNRTGRESLDYGASSTDQPDDLAPYSGVGTELRSARERAGLTITDVAQRLRIRERQLRAIEDGTFEEVPGQIYARGFVRNYAELMGLDGESLVERFKAETGHVTAPAKLEFPTPTPESRMPRMGLVLLAIIIAAAAYAGWYYMNDIRNLATELISDVPERLGAGDTAGQQQPSDEQLDSSASQPSSVSGENETVAAAGDKLEAGSVASPSNENGSSPPSEPDPQEAASQPADSADSIAEPVTAEQQPADINGETSTLRSRQPEMPQPDNQVTNQSSEQTASTPEPAGAAADNIEQTLPVEPVETPISPPDAVTSAQDAVPAPPTGGAETPPALNETVPAQQQSAITAAPLPPSIPNSNSGNGDYVPQVFGIGNTDSRVALRARFDCWVQVLGPDGEQLLTRILKAGDVYLAPNRSDLKLYASDAGALEVVVDGKSLPPIGTSGEVLRNISLDAGVLLAGAAQTGG